MSSSAVLPADAEESPPDSRLGALTRRLARERAARLEAEIIAETATSELYETVQQLTHAARVAELLSKVTAQANEAANVPEAMAGALASICAYTGWPVGHVLVRSDAQPDTLVSLGVWHLDDTDRLEPFRAQTATLEFPSGTGLPGRCLQSGQPVWIPDLQADANFPRARVAAACGLAAAFAIPVLSRSETAAVLEFYATSIQQPEPTLLDVLGTVGAQLGRVMERDAAERRLTRLALYDGLTGLPNRMLLMDRLRSTLSRARRNGTPVDVLYLDIDDFKNINDSRGHSTGDAVLSALSTRLKDAIRDSDTVGLVAPSTVARLGGDEFAVILDGCEHPELVAERIGELLKAPLTLADGQLFITLSMGVARVNLARPVEGAEDLLGQANLAMHEAKREGKARFIAFEPRMQEKARYRQQLGDELHRAVEQQEFELAYQPVITLEDGRIVGAEALVRWRHPERGMVAPNDFIGRSEETGLIVAIGTWVLGEACRQAARWQGVYDAKFTIAVNVSGRQLREPDFTGVVRTALEQTLLPPQTLCLEMTESILMERDDAAIAMLSQLREEGVHLAIDDFGTGYSSLGALRRLPVDLLKIDRSFVSSLPEDEDAGTIAWAIVRLGHTLGMPVLAEGVETQGQLDALRGFGCDQVQGYLLGRPMTASAFEERLVAQAGAGA